MLLRDRQMNLTAGGESTITEHNLFGALQGRAIDRKDLINNLSSASTLSGASNGNSALFCFSGRNPLDCLRGTVLLR